MKNKRYIIWLIVISVIIGSNTGNCQDSHFPYPVIFVHGLVGDDRGWDEITAWLKEAGLDDGGRMDFCLNQDGDNSKALLSSDYKDYTNVNTLNLGDFYTINFNVDNTGTPYGKDVLSNQAAVVKQGVAVRDAVRHVLYKTGRNKVILVGHSMGGLAVREFMKSHYNNDVAKIVTIGTPHYGSNLTEIPLMEFTPMNIDTRSEAVRDLSRSSTFLFGGKEDSYENLFFYDNVDINCNEITTDNIVGLNQDYRNLDLVARIYIVSRFIKTVGIDGDGVVGISSQYINPSDTIMTDRPHISFFGYEGEQKDIYSIMRGLDEPDTKELAYNFKEDEIIQGFITHQRDYVSKDKDLYKIVPSKKGTLTLSLYCINPIAQFEFLDENLTSVLGKVSNLGGKGQIDIGTISVQVETKAYYIRITGEATTNGKVTGYLVKSELNTEPPVSNTTIKDYDGNEYTTVEIGSQLWSGQNLKTTKYNDGTSIPLVTSNSIWSNLSGSAYCWYSNDIGYKNPYGALYNWYAVNTGKLCPVGWHVPTDEEWTVLINYLGGENIAGGELKETGILHWNNPNTGATNSTAFTGLPGGFRSSFDGTFSNFKSSGDWWSSTQENSIYAWGRSIWNSSGQIYRYSNIDKKSGASVRCICDSPVGNKDLSVNDFIKIYPNPASKEIFIECLNSSSITNCTIEIYNMEGKKVKARNNIDILNKQTINTSDLISGFYFIRIYSDELILNQKIVIKQE